MLGLGVTNNFNSLNQIEGTTVNVARVTMLGEVNYPMGTVTVGSVQAVLHGTTFEAPNIPVAMGSNVLTAIYEGPGFTNTGHMATATVGVVISNRLYAHDANGNLLVLRSLGEGGTNDAVFAYAWDAANQLTNVVRLADDARVLSMRYDALGRRVEVTRADESIERYLYIPGTFMVLAVFDGDNEIKELYTHGPDLSGTLGGAGGIGGILADFRPQTSDLRALHADAMGNIVLVTDESGAEAARYRYTSFGREIQREGDYESRYRFSSKEFDPETGLVYYGYRYYSPQLGRWINRDPIAEAGGINVYGTGNDSVNRIDALGLKARAFPIKHCSIDIIVTHSIKRGQISVPGPPSGCGYGAIHLCNIGPPPIVEHPLPGWDPNEPGPPLVRPDDPARSYDWINRGEDNPFLAKDEAFRRAERDFYLAANGVAPTLCNDRSAGCCREIRVRIRCEKLGVVFRRTMTKRQKALCKTSAVIKCFTDGTSQIRYRNAPGAE